VAKQDRGRGVTGQPGPIPARAQRARTRFGGRFARLRLRRSLMNRKGAHANEPRVDAIELSPPTPPAPGAAARQPHENIVSPIGGS
jgi:hypothetical protein